MSVQVARVGQWQAALNACRHYQAQQGGQCSDEVDDQLNRDRGHFRWEYRVHFSASHYRIGDAQAMRKGLALR